jgi:3-dehydroquinate dehydratase
MAMKRLAILRRNAVNWQPGHGMELDWFQSNLEGELIEKIQQAVGKVDWIIINAAGLTHTSVVLRDALSLFPGGVIEVHLSNVIAANLSGMYR